MTNIFLKSLELLEIDSCNFAHDANKGAQHSHEKEYRKYSYAVIDVCFSQAIIRYNFGTS